jgi:hypothetical protein
VKKILYLSGLGIFLLFIILSQFFIKVNIDCKSQYGECPSEVVTKLSVFKGKSIFTARNGLKKSLGSNFLVNNYSTQFKLPNILHVELLIKKPLYGVKNESSNTIVLVDKEGEALVETTETTLPILTISGELPKIAQVVNEKNLFALKLIDGVYKMYQVRNGLIQNDTLLVDLPASVRVIFPLVGVDSDVLLGSLRLIYMNIQSEAGGTSYKEIDMRYINPVLR